MIYIPDHGESCYNMGYLFKRFAGLGVRVFAFDRKGFGMSQGKEVLPIREYSKINGILLIRSLFSEAFRRIFLSLSLALAMEDFWPLAWLNRDPTTSQGRLS